MLYKTKMQIEIKYKSIEARRFISVKGPININNNSTVTSVEKNERNLGVNFVFTSNYEPNAGLVKIEGILLLNDSKEKIKMILDEWESSNRKNLPREVAEKVHNTILTNCIVEATILSKEVQLPAPIPTPRVSLQGKEKKQDVKVDYIR